MRIIAGSCKGRKLHTPKGTLTRPTLDRVRETIFNVLQNYGFVGAHVLDIFAGTGALGLEALSRGAATLTSIDHKTASLIEENAYLCHVEDQINICKGSVQKCLPNLVGKQFSLIFIDPPYEKGLINVTITFLATCNLVSPHGIVVVEHHEDESISTPSHWICLKEQSFGYICVTYFCVPPNERS